MGDRVRRREDDDRATRSPPSPLPHSRNRKRHLPLQEQLSQCRQTHQGEISELDERLTPKPSLSRVSSQRKSRVKSRRKSTDWPSPGLRLQPARRRLAYSEDRRSASELGAGARAPV